MDEKEGESKVKRYEGRNLEKMLHFIAILNEKIYINLSEIQICQVRCAMGPGISGTVRDCESVMITCLLGVHVKTNKFDLRSKYQKIQTGIYF